MFSKMVARCFSCKIYCKLPPLSRCYSSSGSDSAFSIWHSSVSVSSVGALLGLTGFYVCFI